MKVDKLCHEASELVRVAYTSARPTTQNWVGIYEEKFDTDSVDIPLEQADELEFIRDQSLVSQWTCGSHDSDCPTDQPEVFFDVPSKPGRYKILVQSFGYHGSTLQIVSESFEVLGPNRSCSTNGGSNHHESIHTGVQRHFTTGMFIPVSFDVSSPHSNDVVALMLVEPEGNDHHLPAIWMYSCGGRTCEKASPRTTVYFGTHNLASGTYLPVMGHWADELHTLFETTATAPTTISFLETKDCENLHVATSKDCYKRGEDIEVEFESERCQHASDKIAIFEATTIPSDSVRPTVWLYTCGSSDCLQDPLSDRTYSVSDSFDGDIYRSDEDETTETSATDSEPGWPLSPGMYKAVLIRQNPGDSVENVYFSSEPFQIVSDEDSEECPSLMGAGIVDDQQLAAPRRMRSRIQKPLVNG